MKFSRIWLMRGLIALALLGLAPLAFAQAANNGTWQVPQQLVDFVQGIIGWYSWIVVILVIAGLVIAGVSYLVRASSRGVLLGLGIVLFAAFSYGLARWIVSQGNSCAAQIMAGQSQQCTPNQNTPPGG